MYRNKLDKDIRCPLEYELEIFGGKWKSRIICVLTEKSTLRYSELRKEMSNITDAVLAATLKELITNNMIQRKSYDEIPPRVEDPSQSQTFLHQALSVVAGGDCYAVCERITVGQIMKIQGSVMGVNNNVPQDSL